MYGDDAGKLKTFPHFDRPDYDYFMRKFVWFNLLDYIDYNKEEKKKFLQEKNADGSFRMEGLRRKTF